MKNFKDWHNIKQAERQGISLKDASHIVQSSILALNPQIPEQFEKLAEMTQTALGLKLEMGKELLTQDRIIRKVDDFLTENSREVLCKMFCALSPENAQVKII